MRNAVTISLFAVFTATVLPLHAQTTASSFSNVAQKRGTTRLAFNIGAEGLRSSIRWGMDVAWDNESNVQRGVNFIGQANLTLGRASFQPSDLLTNGHLSTAQSDALRSRLNHLNLMGNSNSFDVILNCDHEALNVDNYSPNYRANTARWAELIDATTRQTQQWGYNVIGVAPFNEPDYGTGQSWGWKEGNEADFLNIATRLKTDYKSTFDSIAIVGGNTLNCDNALSWYNTLKTYLGMGNTHQLAGSFDSYANFFSRVVSDGKTAIADELHNVGEAIVGQQYGMSMGIWWGFDGVARGQFCRATSSVNPGYRLGYAEDRSSWTSAAVYRNVVDGTVEGFLGSSERQANDHSFEFVSVDRDVYYDGRGPLRQFVVDMPGGTGYQQGQTNAERLVSIQYGEDVPRREITAGQYIIMNRSTRQVLQPTANAVASGSTVTTARRNADNAAQTWTVEPVSQRVGGDFSYYLIKADTIPLDNLNWSLSTNTNIILYAGDGGGNEQWYLRYAGDGCYYIVNRHSGYLLSKSGALSTVTQQPLYTSGSNTFQQWRIMPVGNQCETIAPQAPSGLTATANAHSISLSWTASTSSDACGYTVFRATNGQDDWNTIARGITETQFVDNSVSEGVTYIYKVKTLDTGDNLSRSASNEVTATTTPANALIAHWTMDGTLADATDNHLDASATTSASYVSGRDGSGKAVSFTGSGGFLQLPYSLGSLDAMTFAAWVNITSSSDWQRIFDFGNGTDQYVFLTPRAGGQTRLAIKNGGDEQQVNTTGLALNRWVHVAVTIGGGQAAVYIDGEKKAESNVSIKLSDFCPVVNYLGRSQFGSDPVLRGSMQDVRIYNYVLADADIAAIYNGQNTGVTVPSAQSAAKVKARHDVSGRRVGAAAKGLLLETTTDGKTRKVMR